MPERFHIILRWPQSVETPSWEAWVYLLERQSLAHSFYPVAFVLMGTHFHLLCSGKMIRNEWWKFLGMELCFLEVVHPKYALLAYRYIYQNPLRAKLVLHVEDYPYHSLEYNKFRPLIRSALLRERASLLPYHLQNRRAELSWLNGNSSLYLPHSDP